MPELPEVETVVRTLRPQIVGSSLTSVAVFHPGLIHRASFPLQTIVQHFVADVTRRGKLILVRLVPSLNMPQAQGFTLAIHLRMTGSLFVYPVATPPNRYTRAIFHLCNGRGVDELLFFDDIRSFGEFFVGDAARLDQWSFWRNLGPEPLTLCTEDFVRKLFSGRSSIKSFLLNQRNIAGIGNIYADESLFQAGLHPLTATSSMTEMQSCQLLDAIKQILRRAISQCGSTIRNYRDANGNVGAFQNTFCVYGRAGLPCVRCGRILQRIRVAGRTSVFCPSCQKSF